MANSNDWITVRAKIKLKTPEEGGRATGIKSGYRPNHVFEQPSNIHNIKAYIGDIQLADNETIQPGEAKIVTVRFYEIKTRKSLCVSDKSGLSMKCLDL